MIQEIIIMVGYPGAGKTTYSNDNFDSDHYIILDGDSLKTGPKVVKALKIELNGDKSIVVDVTNMTLNRRNPLMKLAKEKDIKVKCVWFDLDIKTCLARVKSRYEDGGKKIPPVALYSLRKNYVEPTLDEGFAEIIIVEDLL